MTQCHEVYDPHATLDDTPALASEPRLQKPKRPSDKHTFISRCGRATPHMIETPLPHTRIAADGAAFEPLGWINADRAKYIFSKLFRDTVISLLPVVFFFCDGSKQL